MHFAATRRLLKPLDLRPGLGLLRVLGCDQEVDVPIQITETERSLARGGHASQQEILRAILASLHRMEDRMDSSSVAEIIMPIDDQDPQIPKTRKRRSRKGAA